jgi:hypothetical protein
MSALSSADKLKLRLSAARVERWNRERKKPAKNHVITASGELKPVVRCQNVWAHGQEKPEELIVPDKTESVQRMTDGYKVRTMAGKLDKHGNAIAARVHTISHTDPLTGKVTYQVVQDCASNDPMPQDPAYKVNAPKYAKSRPNSPFKRAGASLSSVVIVRK